MGIAAAIGGAAVIGAGASIYGSSTAASSANKAATKNNALQQQIYAENQAALSPYEDRGNSAGTAINALLGLGNSTPNYAGYVQGNPDLLAAYNASGKKESMVQWGEDHWNTNGQYEGRAVTPTSSETGGSSAATQDAAFQNYENSTGYQFQLNNGLKSVQAALGAQGLTDSGAAQKSLNNYAQNQALTGFNSYLSALQGQQGAGLTAASAQAGVGQNYANATSANNNAAATATGNAALSGANGVNSALGSALTAYSYNQGLGSSYGAATANSGLGGIY